MRYDHLDGPGKAVMLEAGAQHTMPLHQRLYRRLQGLAVERPGQTHHQLHRVQVGCLRIVQRVEQQALLQRRERQHILICG